MKRIFIFLALCLLALPAAAADKATEAYHRGDYEAAFREWLPMAEAGDAEAQYHVGAMYLAAEGVPLDLKAAAHWLGLAAEQGHAAAQTDYGVLHFNGQGVPQNIVQAYKWFVVAMELGSKSAKQRRDVCSRRMTADEVEMGKDLAAKWLADHRKN